MDRRRRDSGRRAHAGHAAVDDAADPRRVGRAAPRPAACVVRRWAHRAIGPRACSPRATDIASRLGGDEFAVCLLDTPLSGAEKTAQKLIAILARPFVVSGIEAQISASVGVAAYPIHAQDADTLLKSADRAMYRAKSE